MKKIGMISIIFGILCCNMVRPKQPDLIDILNSNFSAEKLDKANRQFNQWINTSLEFVAPHVLHIYNTDWKPLIHINSKYTRMVVFIPNWWFIEGNTYNSMIWILGFYTDGQWYFYRPNETQYMSFKEGDGKDFDPLLWKTTKGEIEKYTRNYIKYDKDLKGWKINDRWFTGYFDNRDNLLLEHHWTLTDDEINKLPDSYWIDRYLKMARIHTYKIAKTRKYWEEEDRKYSNKEISEEEWAIIQGRRNPITSEDIRNVQRFYKDVLRDDNDTTYVNLRNDLAPDYKANLEKRRKRFGRKSQ